MFPGKMLKKQITTDFFKNISRIITILKIRLSTIFSAHNASQCNDYQSERYLLFSSSNFQLSCEQCIASQLLRGRSQTTFTRRGRQVVQKCPLFVNVHTIENVNAGGQVVKKSQNLVNVVCEHTLTIKTGDLALYARFSFATFCVLPQTSVFLRNRKSMSLTLPLRKVTKPLFRFPPKMVDKKWWA